jgi:hypothetical protein
MKPGWPEKNILRKPSHIEERHVYALLRQQEAFRRVRLGYVAVPAEEREQHESHS